MATPEVEINDCGLPGARRSAAARRKGKNHRAGAHRRVAAQEAAIGIGAMQPDQAHAVNIAGGQLSRSLIVCKARSSEDLEPLRSGTKAFLNFLQPDFTRTQAS